MRAIPPSEVLSEEFGVQCSAGLYVNAALAEDMSNITGTTPEFWLNLQAAYDAAKGRG